jgi:hypothetical protein
VPTGEVKTPGAERRLEPLRRAFQRERDTKKDE